MHINKIGSNLNFGNNSEDISSSFMSSLQTTGLNALSGAAIGAAMGGVGTLLPVSSNATAKMLSDAFMVYKKAEIPLARETSELTSQLKTALNNNEWLGFIKNIKDMPEDLFIKQSSEIAKKLKIAFSNLPKGEAGPVVSRAKIIETAEKNLIGNDFVIKPDEFIKGLQENLAKKSGELFDMAKKFLKENPGDELVKLSKKAAKSARNSGIMKSSIKFGVTAAMLLSVFNALQSYKSAGKE